MQRVFILEFPDKSLKKHIYASNLTNIPKLETLRKIKHQNILSQLDENPFRDLCLLQEDVHKHYICLLNKLLFGMIVVLFHFPK